MPLNSLIERSGSRSRSALGVRDRSRSTVPAQGRDAPSSVLLIKDQPREREIPQLLAKTRVHAVTLALGIEEIEGVGRDAARNAAVSRRALEVP